MNIQEQIRAFEEKRAALVASNEAIMEKAAGEGTTLDAEQSEEFDGNEADIKAIDKHLERLRAMEKAMLAKAAPAAGSNAAEAGASRAGIQVKRQPKLDAGIEFARIAKVKAIAKLETENVRDVARKMYGEASQVYEHFTKAAVEPANTQDPSWAGNLITEGNAFADFVEFLRPQTILGKFGTGNIPSLRSVPFDVPILVQTSGGEGYWVGEGKPKPLTKWGTERKKLEPLKVATIAAATEEMLRRSTLAADAWIRDELARALKERLDRDFIDPTKAAVSDVSPASITNGVTPIMSSGNDADSIRTDLRALSAAFRTNNSTSAGGVYIMPEGVAEALSMMTNPLGQAEFPGITPEGGTFNGKPVITSEYVPSAYDPDDAGTEDAGAIVVLAKASEIFFADEGGIQVDMSREASLEMSDAPTADGIAGTGASLVSLWQNNMVGFRAERILNWMKRRDNAVAVLASVNWAG
ncbi:phage major capsid protein [Pelagerythrobacter marinus]|nr:phage major capsid protein [Pelagerythrobacter marinus]